MLVDTGVVIWATDTLDEGLRQALSDISGVTGSVLLLSGLDSAASTTVDVRDDDLLIRGAAGYAAKSRAADRAEMISVVLPAQPAGMAEWGSRELDDFRDGLELVRRRVLQSQATTVAPAGEWTWDETNKNW
jgi:hypothetical protein